MNNSGPKRTLKELPGPLRKREKKIERPGGDLRKFSTTIPKAKGLLKGYINVQKEMTSMGGKKKTRKEKRLQEKEQRG